MNGVERNKGLTQRILQQAAGLNEPISIIPLNLVNNHRDDSSVIAIDCYLSYPQLGLNELYLSMMVDNSLINDDNISELDELHSSIDFGMSHARIDETSRLYRVAGVAYTLNMFQKERIPLQFTDQLMQRRAEKILIEAKKQGIDPSKYFIRDSVTQYYCEMP